MMNRTQICRMIYEAVGVRWDYIDSVKRRKKRGIGRIKRRHATRLKWALYSVNNPHRYISETDIETRRLAVQAAQRLGLKYYERFEEGAWWGSVVIYVPNTMEKPPLPITDEALRSHFGFDPHTPMIIVADKIQDEGHEEYAILIRQQTTP